MTESLQSSFPRLDPREIDAAVLWAIENNHKIPKAELNNNYTKKAASGTLLDVLEYIEKLEPIITSSGVLYKKHKEIDNPLSRMVQEFLKQRKVYKDEMKKHDKGTAMYARYNLLQQVEKVNANSVYGVLGAPTSLYYNIYVAESVTRAARSYISQSIMFFESFLANNVKFNSLNEVMVYIYNVVHEKDTRKLRDQDVLDRNIEPAEVFIHIMNTADPLIWIPTDKQMSMVWDRLLNLSQEDLNRLYYKNNLYEFIDLSRVKGVIIDILTSLQGPFMNVNEPPEEIVDKLNTLVELIKEYVYYKYPYIDKLDRIEYMQRDVVCISD